MTTISAKNEKLKTITPTGGLKTIAIIIENNKKLKTITYIGGEKTMAIIIEKNKKAIVDATLTLLNGDTPVAKITADHKVYIDKPWCMSEPDNIIQIVSFLVEYIKLWNKSTLYAAMRQNKALTDHILLENTLCL